MDKAIREALSGLIPTFSGELPAELVELATSLVVQSRSKAISLKKDEEIARPYACANLACERLKLSLKLPKVQPRPPCPPKIYQKLYKFLDATLLTGKRRSAGTRSASRLDPVLRSSPANPKTLTKSTQFSRPAGIKRIAETQETTEEESTTAELTSKRRTPNKALSARKSTRNRASGQRSALIEPPQWTMPAIRRLCDKLNALSAPHHVFAGVSSILAFVSSDEIQIEAELGSALKNIPALIMVVFFAVYARLAAAETPVAVFMEQQAIGFEILNGFAGSGAVGNEISQSEDFETLLLAMSQRGWAQMDWFENIKPGAGLELESLEGYKGGEDGIVGEEDSTSNLRDRYGEDKDQLQAGLGTMMQDQLDYLSEKRRIQYREWKEKIMSRIKEMEQADKMSHSKS